MATVLYSQDQLSGSRDIEAQEVISSNVENLDFFNRKINEMIAKGYKMGELIVLSNNTVAREMIKYK